MEDVTTLNGQHKVLISKHMKFLQARIFMITERDNTIGKFLDFQDILDTIIKYSNDFEKHAKNDRGEDEWMYMIPTLSLYASLGFIAGIKNDQMETVIDFDEESRNLVESTLDIIGGLSDVLQEHREREGINNEMQKLHKEIIRKSKKSNIC